MNEVFSKTGFEILSSSTTRQSAIFRTFIFLFVTAMSFQFVRADASDFVLTGTEIKTLEKLRDKPLRLVYSYDLFYREKPDDAGGGNDGALLPFLNFLEQELKLNVEKRKLPRKEALDAVRSGEADIYGIVGLDRFLLDGLFQTGPFYQTEGVVVSRFDSMTRSALSLRGKKVGVLYDAAIGETIRLYLGNQGELLHFDAMTEMIAALESKQIDCFATTTGILSELLGHPGLEYDFTLRNYELGAGFVSGRLEMKPLLDLLERYLDTPNGKRLKDTTIRARSEVVLRLHRERMAEDIEYVRNHFEIIKVYDCSVLYPLCFQQDKKKKGILVDILDILTQLTGLPCEIGEWDCGDEGLPVALDKIRKGEIQLTSGGYSNLEQWKKDGVAWSIPVCNDMIRPYSYKRKIDSFRHARIACPPNVVPYFQWNNLSDKDLTIVKTRREIFEDLKKKDFDLVFIGEMSFNYRSAILKDNELYENDGPTAEAELRLILGPQNAALNRLIDEAIRLYPLLYPKAGFDWQEKAKRIKTDHIRYHEAENRLHYRIGGVILVSLAVISALLYHFVKYDRQIVRLIQKQQTFDLAWGDLKSKRVKSKGNYILHRKWGFDLGGTSRTMAEIDQALQTDRQTEMPVIMERLKKSGDDLIVQDDSLVSPLDGKRKYFRRHIHRIDDRHYMVCTQDTTTLVEAEQQEQFLFELFDVMPDGFLFLDRDLKILHSSRAMKELFPNFDPTKQYCYDCYRGLEAPCSSCPTCRTFVDGRSHTELEFVESSGKWVETTSYPVIDPETGQVVRVLKFLNDVTEREHRQAALREREAFLEAVLDASYDGIVVSSPESRREILVNQRLREMMPEWSDSFFDLGQEENFERFCKIAKNPEEIKAAIAKMDMDPGRIWEGFLHLNDGRIIEWRGVSRNIARNIAGLIHIWALRDVTDSQRNAEIIRQSEKRLHALFDSMTNVLVLLDVVCDETGHPVDYLIADVNPAGCHLANLAAEDLVGRSLLRIGDEFNVQVFGFEYDRWWAGLDLAADGVAGSFHCHIKGYKDSPYQEAIVFPFGEKRLGILLYDETFRMRMEEKLRTMQLIIDHLSMPVQWLHLDGTIQYANKALAEFLGYDSPGVKPDGPISEKIWNYDMMVKSKDWPEFVRRIEEKGVLHFDTRMLRRDGREVPVTVTVDLIERKGEPFLASCFHDLSEQTRRIEAEQAALAKSRFLNNMSREIRMPINGVVGIANILLGSELEQKQREYVELIRASGLDILTLLNNVLDYSQIDSGRAELDYAEFDLLDLVDSVVGTFAQQAFKQKLEICVLIEKNLPRHVVGDKGRLRKILSALLSNAVKFTESGGVKLTISPEFADADIDMRAKTDSAAMTGQDDKTWLMFRFDVEDTGIGLSPEMVRSILGAESESRMPNSGIGLAIGRELINLMGGTKGLSSRESIDGKNGGSNFWFIVPLHVREAEEPDPTVNQSNISLRNDISISLAIENELLRESLVDQFDRFGMDVLSFDNASNCLKSMRQGMQQGKTVQLLVVDQQLSDGNGTDLIRALRDDFLLDETRIILLLPLNANPDAENELARGADRVVAKPVIGPILCHVALELLEQAPSNEGENAKTTEAEPLASFTYRRKRWQRHLDEDSVSGNVNDFFPDRPLLRTAATTETGPKHNPSEVNESDTENERNLTNGNSLAIKTDETQEKNTSLVRMNVSPILIVEDHDVNRIVVGEILADAGYRFDVAENGAQACAAVASKAYSLILMDLQMPVMDGFDAARKIRIMEAGLDERKPGHSGRIPILALTANVTKQDERQCFEAGMDAFCKKPIVAEKLIEIVRYWLPKT